MAVVGPLVDWMRDAYNETDSEQQRMRWLVRGDSRHSHLLTTTETSNLCSMASKILDISGLL